MSRPGVVHVISALPYGGVETNLLRVLPPLQDEFDVRVVTTREKGDLADRVAAAGVPVDLVPLRTRYDPGSLRRLARYFREHGTRIVHCHMRRANTSGRIAALLARVPVRIATEHDLVLDKSWRHHLVDRLLARWSDCVLGVTRQVVEVNQAASGIPAERWRVMYLGLDLEALASGPDRASARQALGIDVEGTWVGFLGRLHAVKNVDAIIRALAETGLREHPARLLIVGDGRERAALEALVRALGLGDRVHFAGFRDDQATCFAAMDCLVMASSSEGIATVQMEAAAAGLPLVTTGVGIAREVMTAGNEYVALPDPSPASIATGILDALDPQQGPARAERARQTIQAFSLERQVEWLRGLYRERLAARGAG